MNIGFRIKLARERLGWSQRDLAVKSNSSNASISRWENNARDITAQNIIALAIALEVSPNWLLTGDDYYNVDIVYERVEEEAPKKKSKTNWKSETKFHEDPNGDVDPIKVNNADTKFLYDNDDAIIFDLKKGNPNG